MIFENKKVTVFHYDDKNETYTKTVFSGAEVSKTEKIESDGKNYKGDSEKTSGVIRIPSGKSLGIFVGDYVLIGETDDLRPDFARVNKICAVKENFRGMPFLRHIRIDII